jgi:CBS domain-containing protein
MPPPVSELMRRDFIVLHPQELANDVGQVLRLARVRHLPVVRDGRLLGMVSHRDVLEDALAALERAVAPARLRSLRERNVEHLVRGDLVAVAPDCPLARAVELMLRFGIGFLPVVERDRLVGIVTESDLLRAAYAGSGGSSPV